jgi:hypothetical protein
MIDNPFQAAVGGGKPPPSAMDMLSKHDMDSSGRVFLKAPKGVIESIMSSIIEDKDTASALAAFYIKCVRFHLATPDGEMMQWLQSTLAGWRGVNGASLVLALETMIGAISEITTTSALGLKGVDDLAKRVRQNREKENKVEKGKVQD